ncbi:hypothetical protein L226DRAFT_569389 [Lentinus tigrinus ALCF2SS1-7]|uniref:uncharacterized protein n=1 Tax=Lentinus tigrinus ALCF2SS1-7 TaxID=1328758 RepID=UPI001165E989|nr:hypothetical protein L226DRAFT_569389 [Lentinus tigrinus ALCF2SS1-7]
MKIAASGDAESRRARQSAQYKAPASAQILFLQNHDVLSPLAQVLVPRAVLDLALLAGCKLPNCWVCLRVTTSFTGPPPLGGLWRTPSLDALTASQCSLASVEPSNAFENLLDVDGL